MLLSRIMASTLVRPKISLIFKSISTLNPIVAAESGFVIYWKVDEEKVIFKEEQKDILQVMLYDDKRKSLFVSKVKSTGIGDLKALCIARTVPQGK